MPDNNDRAAASEPGDQSAHDDETTGGDQPSPDPADLHSARSDIPPADELDARDRQSRLIASRYWGWSKRFSWWCSETCPTRPARGRVWARVWERVWVWAWAWAWRCPASSCL